MPAKQIFSVEEKAIFSNALEVTFKKAGFSDLLTQNPETTNNHLDEEFFAMMDKGYHLEKDNALQGI